MSIFTSDSSLPPLPLPELSATCESLKNLVRPLNSPEEYGRICTVIDEFSVTGQSLQDKLVSFRDSMGANESWLRPLWDDSYLAWRGKLPMEMNYALELQPERWGDTPLASFVVAMCCFLRSIGKEDLPVEKVRDLPLSMDSLRFMAYTRIPGLVRDTLYRVPLSGPIRIAVASRGNWAIMTLSDAGGNMASVAEVDKALRGISEAMGHLPSYPPIGAMTASEREKAAAVRGLLQQNISNRCALSDIENCLFSLSLDCGEDSANFGHSLIAGDSGNRWFDKSLQVISSPDGRIGLNLEHAGCDAGLWTYALNWVDRSIREQSGMVKDSEFAIRVKPLAWQIDNEVSQELAVMDAEHRKNAVQMSCVFQLLTVADRKKVKALGCGPDVFTQLSFQAAYHRLTGGHASVYEAVSVRNFFQGRTECARPATLSAIEFAKLLSHEAPDAEALRSLYEKAEREHKDRLGCCQKGIGVERHLFGLGAMAQMQGGADREARPGLFTDSAVLASTRNTLSTSNVSGPSIRFFGFGPVVEDGLGIGYALTEDGLQLTVTSLAGSPVTARQFASEMETVMGLMVTRLQSVKDA